MRKEKGYLHLFHKLFILSECGDCKVYEKHMYIAS